MHTRQTLHSAPLVSTALLLAACFGGRAPAAASPATQAVVVRTDTLAGLPRLPAQPISETRDSTTVPAEQQRLVSVHAIDADVRPLLIGLAREAGINIVVASDVNRRVTLRLTDVPATEAIAAIASAADLSIALPRRSTLPTAVVYYQLPVDIKKESAETISAR